MYFKKHDRRVYPCGFALCMAESLKKLGKLCLFFKQKRLSNCIFSFAFLLEKQYNYNNLGRFVPNTGYPYFNGRYGLVPGMDFLGYS